MFDINIWPLLNTHPGDRIELRFEDSIPADTWDDFIVEETLCFELELIAIETGVDVIMRDLQAIVSYEGIRYSIEIPEVERTFVKSYEPDMPDDINPINMKHATIDFGKVLREEILMQIL